MIDRQFDQLGKVLVCVNAVTIRHRGRGTGAGLAIAALEIDCWVEWVNSDANIADIPSRPIHQRGQLYTARPVFKQIRMVFPTIDDCLNPSAFFQALRMPST